MQAGGNISMYNIIESLLYSIMHNRCSYIYIQISNSKSLQGRLARETARPTKHTHTHARSFLSLFLSLHILIAVLITVCILALSQFSFIRSFIWYGIVINPKNQRTTIIQDSFFFCYCCFLFFQISCCIFKHLVFLLLLYRVKIINICIIKLVVLYFITKVYIIMFRTPPLPTTAAYFLCVFHQSLHHPFF